MRRKLALGNKFNEKFQRVLLIRRRNDRVSTLDSFSVVFHPERGVLPGLERKGSAGRDFDQPQIFREIAPFEDGGLVVFIARRRQTDFAHSLLSSLYVLQGLKPHLFFFARSHQAGQG